VDSILDNYDHYNEDQRLADPYGVLEEAHTRELISRFLGTEARTVADVGGGTGPYAFWLADQGHRVHLVDYVPRHVELARSRNGGRLASLSVGDARTLGLPDGSVDFVLLNGPLYHLVDPVDRAKALAEAGRVLVPGGQVFAVGIPRLSGLVYALSSGQVFDEDYYALVQHELATGHRDNRNRRVRTFVEAFFHTSIELRREVAAAGFDTDTPLGILGQAWNTSHLAEVVADPVKRKRLLDVARAMEPYPEFAPKMVCMGRKRAEKNVLTPGR
jgi:ubiquinone/menaquinone biosynthesis C-methylase UbiE